MEITEWYGVCVCVCVCVCVWPNCSQNYRNSVLFILLHHTPRRTSLDSQAYTPCVVCLLLTADYIVLLHRCDAAAAAAWHWSFKRRTGENRKNFWVLCYYRGVWVIAPPPCSSQQNHSASNKINVRYVGFSSGSVITRVRSLFSFFLQPSSSSVRFFRKL